jgi:hypothetical protein
METAFGSSPSTLLGVVLGKDDVAILKIKLLSVCLLVLTRLSDGNVYEAIANTFIERFSVLANDRLAD